MFKRSLFLFHRDLRLNDNTGLIEAARASQEVIPAFIIDPRIMNKQSDAPFRIAFMIESLQCLDNAIKQRGGQLLILQGNPVDVLAALASTCEFDALFTNRDYTPLARHRDHQIHHLCKKLSIHYCACADQLLNEPEAVCKRDGKPYVKFTSYYNKARQHYVPPPVPLDLVHFCYPKVSTDIANSRLKDDLITSRDVRRAAPNSQPVLADLVKLTDYDESRDYPATDGTSRLSAHLRFGTCSIREVYHCAAAELKSPAAFQRQLYWRDFYHHIGFHFPRVFSQPFNAKYEQLKWDANEQAYDCWRDGRTGFPIVDAGLRELAATGYMHNRVRMITASLLCKNLNINWRLGEQHFKKLLIDFDPAVNNGNWQWCASTGCDSQPYFRVFNPWRQQRRYDPDGCYIKQWLPELQHFSSKDIHNELKMSDLYLPPVVDIKLSSAESISRFKAIKRA